MLFAVPVVWREPNDCLFGLTNVKDIKSKTIYRVKYPNLPFAMRSLPHSEELPVPNLRRIF
jgi:hypothetical protein